MPIHNIIKIVDNKFIKHYSEAKSRTLILNIDDKRIHLNNVSPGFQYIQKTLSIH